MTKETSVNSGITAAKAALDAWSKSYNGKPNTLDELKADIEGLLTDFMHLAMSEKLDMDEIFYLAFQQYKSETREHTNMVSK